MFYGEGLWPYVQAPASSMWYQEAWRQGSGMYQTRNSTTKSLHESHIKNVKWTYLPSYATLLNRKFQCQVTECTT